ncbi:uncharacterized protein LOC132174250 [Corylus avellana]|uniref:uncharacterized protein LOC132174250 n=1 Tax=Corylus avellana TaxID=13451 RepID=UPI00286B8EFA|nr:uncharacterized protein LOC132174250 [Corylus avellana]
MRLVSLPVTVGTTPRQSTTMVDFLVIDRPSSYNAIIGRPSLNKLKAVTSTYHLMMKFPIEEGVGVVKGDQVTARKCYNISLKKSEPSPLTVGMVGSRSKVPLKGEPAEPLEEVKLEEGKVVKVGTQLASKIRDSLITFLQEIMEVFAWTHEDMPGINPDDIVHQLNVDPNIKLVRQKRRKFAPERNMAIAEEVEKLLKARFIEEVYYLDWLANVVLVKKSSGKWKMCVDFTDLNKACSKDSFPLPCIGALVDSTARYGLLSFIDAFSGYNQIYMHLEDQEKTAFITDRGLYCYKVLPFGLKNVGATYQRLVNKMFRDQIGCNMDLYVDDMLVKSMLPEGHIEDLQETFGTLKKYGMKLNPAKSEEVSDQHTSVKQSRSRGSFVFKLAVSPTTISAALIREEDGVQKPVYFISRALRGAEERYPQMEKLAFALIIASRKLRLYFQAHTIRVLTEYPLKKKEETGVVYVDGSSTRKNGGAGVVLITPDGEELCSSLRLEFKTTNNETEYEAVLVGLGLAREMGADFVELRSDSQVIVGHIRGEFEARGDKMKQYLSKVQDLQNAFRKLCIMKIPREENERADQLARKASTAVSGVEEPEVPIQVLSRPAIPETVSVSVTETVSKWQRSIREYLEQGTLPSDKKSATQIKIKAARFTIINGVLYKRGFMLPLLKCISKEEGDYVLREIHEGICGNHSGARVLAHKAVRAGFYWPNINRDSVQMVRNCDKCQRFANIAKQPPEDLSSISSLRPFSQWGVDIVRPLPRGKGGMRFAVVAVDYFTKWAEVEALVNITAKSIERFL